MRRLSVCLFSLILLSAGGGCRSSSRGLVDPVRWDADAGIEAGAGDRPGSDVPGMDVIASLDAPMDAPASSDLALPRDQAPADLPVPVDQCAAPAPCGACGGMVLCDGTCSKPTPPNLGQPCGKCAGTIACDGTCSKPTPPDLGDPCGKCGGVVQCGGSCSVTDPAKLGMACGSAGTVQCNGGCKGPVFRLWHQATGDHFYTMSTKQRDDAVALYGFVFETVAWQMYEQVVPGTVPLHRLFNGAVTDHLYTISDAERVQVMTGGYVDEGVAGYVHAMAAPGTVPLYRLFSPLVSDHFYTVDRDERDRAIVQFGYVDQGVAAHVLPPP